MYLEVHEKRINISFNLGNYVLWGHNLYYYMLYVSVVHIFYIHGDFHKCNTQYNKSSEHGSVASSTEITCDESHVYMLHWHPVVGVPCSPSQISQCFPLYFFPSLSCHPYCFHSLSSCFPSIRKETAETIMKW